MKHIMLIIKVTSIKINLKILKKHEEKKKKKHQKTRKCTQLVRHKAKKKTQPPNLGS